MALAWVWGRLKNTRNTTFLLFLLTGGLQNGLLTHHTDINMEIAVRTNPTPSPLSASLLDWLHESLISAQHARQALTL